MEQQRNSEKEQSSRSSSNIPTEIYFLTLFPELIEPLLKVSLLGKAQARNLVKYHFIQIRDFATDKNRTVDDAPYGGGQGMILRFDVLFAAWNSLQVPEKPAFTVLLSPQGPVLNQKCAQKLATHSRLILVCGHYEGVDQRFIDQCVDSEISIGNFILTGGELPALVLADTIIRLIPSVVRNPKSVTQDSLENGLLKYPQYTRPNQFNGFKVPEILLSGNHDAIQRWREEKAIETTQKKRPDLIRR